jgi:hypothetical protein
MTVNCAWQQLYRLALLELRTEELPQRIEEAEAAMRRRIVELRGDDSSFREELQALDDALRSMRALANSECKPPQPALSQMRRSEVAQ